MVCIIKYYNQIYKMDTQTNENKISKLSIASLITGIFGIFIIPIILGSLDLNRIKKGLTNEKNKILDILGILFGSLNIVLWVIVYIII